jgi:methyl-accepting chemotaxis protein
MKRSPGGRLILGFTIAIAVVIGIIAVSYRSSESLLRASASLVRTQEVISTLRQILSDVELAETSQRGYVITGSHEYAIESRNVRPRIASGVEHLSRLVSDDATQSQRVLLLRKAIEAKIAYVLRSIRAREQGGFEAARRLAMTGEGRATMGRVSAIIATMEAHELAQLEQRRAAAAAQTSQTRALLIAGGVLDFALLALVFLIVRRDQRFSRDLRRA